MKKKKNSIECILLIFVRLEMAPTARVGKQKILFSELTSGVALEISLFLSGSMALWVK